MNEEGGQKGEGRRMGGKRREEERGRGERKEDEVDNGRGENACCQLFLENPKRNQLVRKSSAPAQFAGLMLTTPPQCKWRGVWHSGQGQKGRRVLKKVW